MINAPESGVLLGQEDTQKIELVNRRLATLQREVLAATQELATLDNEIISTQKAKKYAEEQLISVTAQVEALREEQQKLVLSNEESQTQLVAHRKERVEGTYAHETKAQELDKREKVVLENEKSVAENALSVTVRERQVEADRAEVENARNTFLDAISSVTWR